MLDTGGTSPMLKRRSLFERGVTLPVGAWLVARKQSIRSAVTCAISQLPTSMSSYGRVHAARSEPVYFFPFKPVGFALSLPGHPL